MFIKQYKQISLLYLRDHLQTYTKPGRAAYSLAVLTAMSHFQLQTELAQLLCGTQTGKSGNS